MSSTKKPLKRGGVTVVRLSPAKTSAKVAKNTSPADLTATLSSRGSTYGSFIDNADMAQAIKDAMRAHPGWNDLPATLKEGLDLNAMKVSRMVTGNWRHPDNPHDIAGYAKLMEDFVVSRKD